MILRITMVANLHMPGTVLSTSCICIPMSLTASTEVATMIIPYWTEEVTEAERS